MAMMFTQDPSFLPYVGVPQLLLPSPCCISEAPGTSVGHPPKRVLSAKNVSPQQQEEVTMGIRIIRNRGRSGLIKLTTTVMLVLAWCGNYLNPGLLLTPLQILLWTRPTQWQWWYPHPSCLRMNNFPSLLHHWCIPCPIYLTLLFCTHPYLCITYTARGVV